MKSLTRIQSKKGVFLLLGLATLVFFSLPLVAMAGFWDTVAGAFALLPALIIVTVLAFLVVITQIFVLLAGVILNWVTSPGFITLSYTSPAGPNGNPIIGIGLDITKNFVNLALVVILVYIAVSIALRLEGEGGAKKLFVRLIIIALLVNFAPVIVGLIVDAANIVMNYFLVGIDIGVSDVWTQIKTLSSSIISRLVRVPSYMGQISLVTQALILLVVNIATALILFLFAALFIFRYIIIWVLVILSPLAFVAWILPITKRYWDMWWGQLVQWSIIGIVAAFFIYLGARAYEALPAYFAIRTEMPGIEPEVIGTLNQTLPYFVVSVFLFLGFLLGLQTSAMGATAAIGLTKRAGSWVGKKAWGGVKPMAEEKFHLREAASGLVKTWESAPILRRTRWFMPEKLRKYAEGRPAIEESQKKASTYSSKEIAHRTAIGADYGMQAVGNILEVLGRGDSEDLMSAFKKHYKAKNYEELIQNKKFKERMARLLRISLSGGRHNTILRGDPRLAAFAAGKLPGYEALDEKASIRKAAQEARTQHIANWERETLENDTVVETGMERGSDFWDSIQAVKKGRETALETVDLHFTKYVNEGVFEDKKLTKSSSEAELWEDFRENYKKKHEGFDGYFQYVKTERARGRGWRAGKHLTSQEIEKIEKRRRGEEGLTKPTPVTPGAAAGVGPTPPPPPPKPGETEPPTRLGRPGYRGTQVKPDETEPPTRLGRPGYRGTPVKPDETEPPKKGEKKKTNEPPTHLL